MNKNTDLHYDEKNKIELKLINGKTTHRLIKNYDKIEITHIVFDYDPINLTDDDRFLIKMGTSVIYNASLKFLYLLNKIIFHNNSFILPIKIFEIMVISLAFQNIEIQILINNNNFKNITLITNNSYFDTSYRNQLATNSYDNLIKYPTHISKQINSNKVTFIIDTWCKIDEYFLDCDINNIKSLNINFLSKDLNKDNVQPIIKLIDYDAIMVKVNLKMINKLLAIPLNINKLKYLSNNNSYISNTCVENFIIVIEFFEKADNFTLYTYNYNILAYKNGMATLKFIPNFAPHCYLEALFDNFKYNGKSYEDKVVYATDSTTDILDMIFDNFQDNLLELKFSNPPKDLLNLPLSLRKLEIINKLKQIIIKVPFGCEYIEENF